MSKNKNRIIVVGDEQNFPDVMRFEMQPLMRLRDSAICAYELLFRGNKPIKWILVDECLLNFLHISNGDLPTLFVNLSNEALLNLPHDIFVKAAANNDVVFELSEYFTELATFNKISEKVNELTKIGLKFAIDDFGSGHDGFLRLYSLTAVSAIKIDGSLLHRALCRQDAAITLKALVQQWNASGIMTIAECVETPRMLQFCDEIGFNKVQGWHIDDLVSSNLPDGFSNSIVQANSSLQFLT